MKAFVASMIAIGALWAIDVQFNEGRYTVMIMRGLRPLLAQAGIQI